MDRQNQGSKLSVKTKGDSKAGPGLKQKDVPAAKLFPGGLVCSKIMGGFPCKLDTEIIQDTEGSTQSRNPSQMGAVPSPHLRPSSSEQARGPDA